jgi:ribosome-associated protein
MKKKRESASETKLKLVGLCCRTLDDKKAENIRILDVSKISSITDYFIIATGTSDPHLRSLTQETAQALKDEKQFVVGSETGIQSGWTVLDAHDVIVHLFLPEMRDLYRLDSLWKDGDEVPLEQFVGAPEPLGQQRGH